MQNIREKNLQDIFGMTQGVPSVMDLIERLRVIQSDKNSRVELLALVSSI